MLQCLAIYLLILRWFDLNKFFSLYIVKEQKIKYRQHTQDLEQYHPGCKSHGIYDPYNYQTYQKLFVFNDTNDLKKMCFPWSISEFNRPGYVKSISNHYFGRIGWHVDNNWLAPNK